MSVYRPARVGARPARNQAACSRAASARSGRSSRRVPGKTLTGSPGASGVSRPFSAIATADVSSGTRTFRERCSWTPASVTATATRAAIQQSRRPGESGLLQARDLLRSPRSVRGAPALVPRSLTSAGSGRLSGVSSDRPQVTVPDEQWLGLWPREAEPVDVRVWDMKGDAPGAPELVVLPYMGASAVAHRLAEVPSLRVVQTLSAGYEDVLPHVPEGVLLANGAGIHDTSTAELAVGLAIAALRGLDDFARAMPRGEWLPATRPALADRRVLLVGAGRIASAIADRLAPFEVEVTRVGTRARDDDRGHVHANDGAARPAAAARGGRAGAPAHRRDAGDGRRGVPRGAAGRRARRQRGPGSSGRDR